MLINQIRSKEKLKWWLNLIKSKRCHNKSNKFAKSMKLFEKQANSKS